MTIECKTISKMCVNEVSGPIRCARYQRHNPMEENPKNARDT